MRGVHTNTRRRATRGTILITCPITACRIIYQYCSADKKKSERTEGKIDDNVVCTKFRGEVATGIGEVCGRCPPGARVDSRSGFRDIGGHGHIISPPEPHLDIGICALNSIPSTSVGIEGWPVAVWTQAYTTPNIVVVRRNTVGRNNLSEGARDDCELKFSAAVNNLTQSDSFLRLASCNQVRYEG